ncbi:MAG: glycosyltransferase family 9 protein [Bacteroidetes bacterium]|nr:glycosyltransferase family 9 protein [Bacteroidota bacterium]
MKKILIIRFSSIGDIVLTTPIVRCVKKRFPNAELHFVTKEVFKPILIHNSNINKIHTFKHDVVELYDELKSENFSLIIDLHKNLRSLRLKKQLNVLSVSFKKLNFEKILAVRLKLKNALPNVHIVERYFESLFPIGVENDGKGLDYFIGEEEKINVGKEFFNGTGTKFIALVIGGSYYTKKIPLNKLQEICTNSKLPIVLMGGKEDKTVAEELQKQFPNLINACGTFSINQSVSIIQQAEWVITSDTGLMHIAAAYNKKIISVWGNTIPEFGMSPYKPNAENKILEVKNLFCRPCSKLGYHKCPKGHFKCMNDIDFEFVKELSTEALKHRGTE